MQHGIMDDFQHVRAMQAEIQMMIEKAKEAVHRLNGEPDKSRHGGSNITPPAELSTERDTGSPVPSTVT